MRLLLGALVGFSLFVALYPYTGGLLCLTWLDLVISVKVCLLVAGWYSSPVSGNPTGGEDGA